MRLFAAVLLFVVASFVGLAIADLPDHYEQMDAVDKKNWLWSNILADFDEEGSWYGTLDMLQLFLRSDWPTGNVATDLMPDGRKKLIHTVGAIAKAKFVWANSYDYTGFFRQANHALIRFSTATAADDDSLTAGISVKILRNKVPAGTLIAMYGLDGQPGLNFFEKPLMNRVAEDPNLPLKLQMLAKKFIIASKRFAGSLGLSELAAYDEDGTQVDTNKIKFPWGLALQPNPTVAARLRGNKNKDIPRVVSGVLDGNECLYKVYAVREPRVTPLQYLGYIKLESKCHASKFADHQLFFKHTWLSKDLELRPDWDYWFSESSAKRWETEGVKYYERYLPAWSDC